MIRVFLLALLALAALVMVANHLPYQPAALPAPAAEKDASEDPAGAGAPRGGGPFAPWDGVWEGTITARRLDGSVAETSRVRQEHTTISALEQKVEVTDRSPAGRSGVVRRIQRASGERLECRVTDPSGAVRVMTGSLAGGAILWSRRETATGREEVYREEIHHDRDGDLYSIDGYRRDPSGETLIVEGRLRRMEIPPR